jgi:hypothetical protein
VKHKGDSTQGTFEGKRHKAQVQLRVCGCHGVVRVMPSRFVPNKVLYLSRTSLKLRRGFHPNFQIKKRAWRAAGHEVSKKRAIEMRVSDTYFMFDNNIDGK